MNFHQVLVGISIAIALIAIAIPDFYADMIGYLLILTVGVAHGANDVQIFFHKKSNDRQDLISFIVKYIIAIILVFAAYYLVPDLILSLFILTSGYHFGEQHFESLELKSSFTLKAYYAAYGVMIIMLIFNFNSVESLKILNELLLFHLNDTHLIIGLATSLIIKIILFVVSWKKTSLKKIAFEIFIIILLSAIFHLSTLVLSFAIYFVIWHSIPSINTQLKVLYGSNGFNDLVRYFKQSFFYWIASLLFLVLLFYYTTLDLFLSIIVAFLSGITFPHVFVMNKLFKKHKN